MIRRLPFEEISPPAQAISPIGQSGKPHDDPENESLAIEFKALLEQISGGMASISDQAMAVGLALAQAAPLERAVQRDLQKIEKTDASGESSEDSLVEEQGGDNQNASMRLDVRDTGKRAESRVSEEDEGGTENGSDVEVDQGPVEFVQHVDVTDASTTDSTEEMTTLLSLMSQDVGEDVSQELARLSQKQAAEGPVEAVKVETEEVVEQAEVELTNAQQFVMSEVKAKVQKKEKGDGEEEVGELLDPASLGASQVTVDEDEARKNLSVVGKNTKNAGEKELPQSNQQGQLAQQRVDQEVKGRSDLSRLRESGENSFALSQRRNDEGAQKAPKMKEDISAATAEVIAPSVTKVASRVTEGGVQMTLLRQAFESLKAARQEVGDGRAKNPAPTVNGVNSTSEAKSAQNEAASRSSKGMTRAQTARMLERVESTLKEAARARDGKTISLRLDPANLGRVKVDVSLRDGALHARISPENQQVLVALRENAHDLQGALRKLGLNVDSVSVTVTSEMTKEETSTGQQMTDGRSFQDERNKMPREQAQVAENRSGNELAEWKGVRTPEQSSTVLDHWVA